MIYKSDCYHRKWFGPIVGVLATAVSMVTATGYLPNTYSSGPAGHDYLIPLISQQEVLHYIAQGKQVVFVDAREIEEHEEEHIPGAIDLPLRDVTPETVKSLNGKAMVIAYCLKDFRGFELAKALERAGVENVHVLAKSGINGWKALGLPTTGGKARLSEEASLDRLRECAINNNCIKANKS